MLNFVFSFSHIVLFFCSSRILLLLFVFPMKTYSYRNFWLFMQLSMYLNLQYYHKNRLLFVWDDWSGILEKLFCYFFVILHNHRALRVIFLQWKFFYHWYHRWCYWFFCWEGEELIIQFQGHFLLKIAIFIENRQKLQLWTSYIFWFLNVALLFLFLEQT